jgi:organic hydroperoxide reductase OsmC/OhrA
VRSDHAYYSTLSWRGTTRVGSDSYERTHRVVLPPGGSELVLTSGAAFEGSAALANPEQLLLAATSSCQLLSYLAYAAAARIDVLSYEDHAEALMPADAKPMRITQIVLRPRITVAAGADAGRAARLVERAHRACFIANTLNAEVKLEPKVERAGERPVNGQ